jgi:hypothetical protein
MMAPSRFNAQMWEMVMVDDNHFRTQITELQLSGLGKSSKGFINAPVYLLMYFDERVRKYGPETKKNNDAWWEFTLNSSMSCAFMPMQLAANQPWSWINVGLCV